MIATILPGSSNFHAVDYNERKVAKGVARLLEMKKTSEHSVKCASQPLKSWLSFSWNIPP